MRTTSNRSTLGGRSDTDAGHCTTRNRTAGAPLRQPLGSTFCPPFGREGYICTRSQKRIRDMTTTAETALAPALPLPPRYQTRAILKETAATCVYRVFDVADGCDEAIKILRH